MKSFTIRLSLSSPIGTIIDDVTFEFDKELTARDMLDMCKTICDKYSFETYDEYIKTNYDIAKILEGYEYSIVPKGRKELPEKIKWYRKGVEINEDSDKRKKRF